MDAGAFVYRKSSLNLVFHPDGSFEAIALLQANVIKELFEVNLFGLV